MYDNSIKEDQTGTGEKNVQLKPASSEARFKKMKTIKKINQNKSFFNFGLGSPCDSSLILNTHLLYNSHLYVHE